jgi:apolipoprotein D and lipocalin family protein
MKARSSVSALFVLFALAFSAPSSYGMGGSKLPPLELIPKLDLQAFMGDWNVLGNIPAPQEKGCHNALEQYQLKPDGNIAITFSCNKNSFEAEREVHHFTGIVQNPGINTEWKVAMKFLGFIPIKLPFLVIDLAQDGSYTVIGYPSRDYVWIMAREKTLPETIWNEILNRLKEQHYDTSRILRIPTR